MGQFSQTAITFVKVETGFEMITGLAIFLAIGFMYCGGRRAPGMYCNTAIQRRTFDRRAMAALPVSQWLAVLSKEIAKQGRDVTNRYVFRTSI